MHLLEKIALFLVSPILLLPVMLWAFVGDMVDDYYKNKQAL